MRFAHRGIFLKGGADPEAVKLHTADIHGNGEGVLPGGEVHALGKRGPEGRPPVRPPQPRLVVMRGLTVQRHIDAVAVPERKAEPHRYIVGPGSVDGKVVDRLALIAQRDQRLGNRNDAAVAVRLRSTVKDDAAELGVLGLAVGGQIVPPVVGFRHERLGVVNRIPSLHVVVNVRQRPGNFVVVIPIGHDGYHRLGRSVIGEVVAARHPQLCGVVGVGSASVAVAQVFRLVIDLPVPAVGGHSEKDLLRVHDTDGIIVHALQPASRGNRTRRGACPCHAVGHDGRGVAVAVEVAINTPVFTADRAVDARHTRQADVHHLRWIVGFDRVVDVSEHRRGDVRRGVISAAFQVDVDAGTPRIFLHDADDLCEELVLRAARVIPERGKNAAGAVVGDGQKPGDVRPFVDVVFHGGAVGNGNAALVNLPGRTDLEGEKPDLADAVAVITQRLIHPGIAHKRPDHDFLAFECFIQNRSPPSSISCISNSTLAVLPSSSVTLCLESHAALYW